MEENTVPCEPTSFELGSSPPVIKYIVTDSNTNLLNLVNNYEYQGHQNTLQIVGPIIQGKEKDELKKVLAELRCEFLFEMFLEESINVDALRNMERDHLMLLCWKNKINVGTMITVEQQLKLWKAKIAGENSTDEINVDGSQRSSSGSGGTSSSINLDSILEDTSAGKKIVENYLKDPTLTDASRTVLLTLITNYFEVHGKKMTADNAKSLSEEIVSKFPSEEIGTYYYVKQSGKKMVCKLYNKYFNSQRLLKESGIIEKRPHSPGGSKKVYVRNSKANEIEIEGDIEEDLAAIKQENCNFSELEVYWRRTCGYRIKDIHSISLNGKNTTSEIFSAWPSYKSSLGYKLISIDYTHLYGAIKFNDRFTTSRDKLLNLIQPKLKDQSMKHLVSEINSADVTENQKNLYVIYLLHHLIPPVSRTMVENPDSFKQTCLKFSIKDSQNSMFIFGESVLECEEKIEKLKDSKMPVQPFIIVLGTLHNSKSFIIYFDEVRYKFNCILQAVDACFKIFMLFNLQYPVASILVWNFIQKFFYGIETEFDKTHPNINLIIQKLADKN